MVRSLGRWKDTLAGIGWCDVSGLSDSGVVEEYRVMLGAMLKAYGEKVVARIFGYAPNTISRDKRAVGLPIGGRGGDRRERSWPYQNRMQTIRQIMERTGRGYSSVYKEVRGR